MRIKLKENALQLHARSVPAHAGYTHAEFVWRDAVRVILKEMGGIIEVETEFLFSDQYNTVPIPGTSENGLRIMDKYVEEVLEDARFKRGRCNYCGKTVVIAEVEVVGVCSRCGESEEYVEAFFGYVEVTLRHHRNRKSFERHFPEAEFLGYGSQYYDPAYKVSERHWRSRKQDLPNSCTVVDVQECA